MTNKHTDQELIDLILKLEDELQAKGLVPKYRAFGLPICAMQKLGYKNFLVLDPGSNPLLERIRNLHKRFYRDKDIRSGGSHGGAFMFRGIAAMIHAPIWYGKKEINPWERNDLKPDQRRWLQSNDEDHQAYLQPAVIYLIFPYCLIRLKAATPLLQIRSSFLNWQPFNYKEPVQHYVKLLTYVVQPKVPCWVQNWP